MSPHQPLDLIIRARRVLCPASGLDTPGGVAVRAGRIVAAGADVTGPAEQVLDFPNGLLLPGLVDLHAHPARSGSKYGVDPDEWLLPRGTTTVLSQGDAGANNWLDYRAGTIDVCRTRVRLAINLAAAGESASGGCFEDPGQIDVPACVRTIHEAGPLVWGIAVNLSPFSCGNTDPRWVLDRALAAAEATNKPLLFGPRRGIDDFPLAEQLPRLRPGDVVTYCFHGQAQGLLAEGRVRDCVWEARQRGVQFDIGHGAQSFSFAVAEAAIAQGFLPDTISSDFHQAHLGVTPPHDLPRVMSKLLAAGMAEADVLARVTARPAALLGLAGEIGTLRPGACADLALLHWDPAPTAPLTDTSGHHRLGGCWMPLATVGSGVVFGSAADRVLS